MYIQEISLLFLILIAISLFIYNKWRYDVVGMITLLGGVILGLIPADQAFVGFSNPAVVTVVCIMIISYSITDSGILLPLVNLIAKYSSTPLISITILVTITTILSAFMNNVGALALMMPIAIKIAKENKMSNSIILMPMSFGSVIGGLCTAIGTPPNLLISAFRYRNTGEYFKLLDFSSMGVYIAFAGILFIILLGWRLLPNRKGSGADNSLHELLEYLTEIKILADSPLIGNKYNRIEKEFEERVLCLGYIRNGRKKLQISKNDTVQAGDILIIETSPEHLKNLIQNKYFEIIGDFNPTELLKSDTMSMVEAVVPQGSRMEKRSANSMKLRNRFSVNIVGISREGKLIKERILENKLQGGDVVLLLGESEAVIETANTLGLIPLTQHTTQKKQSRKYLPIISFIGAILLIAFNVLDIQIAFALVVLSLLVSKTISLQSAYSCVEWPIVILLGSMIPLGLAIQSTGASAIIANTLINLTTSLSPIALLAVIMIITMTLSDVMNNAATAVIMAPISITIADSLHYNVDPFLMAVAIGASCSFLTPISHQNNTLVLGPGGYKFIDYIKLGLPLEILIIAIAAPLLPIVWPLKIVAAV